MNNLLSYSGIITKVKAMEARFVTKKDYETIANLDSTADFITYLKNHPGYREIFIGLDEHGVHRAQVEGIFINSLYLDFSKIYRFANLTQRKDLDLIFFRYEVNVLKSCIKSVYDKAREHDLSLFNSFFSNHSKVNVSALAASKSMEEYISNLKGTEYYSLLMKVQSNNINATSFDYEMQLDIHYFNKSWKLKNKLLTGDNLKAMTHSLGTEIDLLNIMWLFRSKNFFNVQSADSYSYVIPVTYKLTKEKLFKLMETASMDEFIAILKTTYYEKISNTLLDGSIEIIYQKIIAKVNQDNKTHYPTSMAPVNYYLYHKLSEVGKLTTALECLRYKLDPQDTLKYIFA
jgi:V/A-type H+-transporting ATPase subunit C